MYIKTLNKDISSISHNNTIHKVIEGIADVPQEVRDHLVKFPEWNDLIEPLDPEIQKELKKKPPKK